MIGRTSTATGAASDRRAAGVVAVAAVLGVSLGVAGCKDDAPTDNAPAAVTPKAAQPDPGNVPQPANPPTPPAAGQEAAAPGVSAPADAAAVAGRRVSLEGISFETPAGWSVAGPKPMRLATVTDNQAEIAITAFPGDVGGSLANVNRWRGQIGLQPLASEAEAEQALAKVDVNGRTVRTLDITGQSQRTLVAIVPGEGRLFFVKLTAAPEVVAARKDAFDGLIKTVRVE